MSATQPSTDPVPAGGVFRNGVHVFPVRVYYECTDAGGIVYHADYLRFAERARTEMMRRFGLSHQDLMVEAGVGFAVQHCEATFHRPALLDDLLMVETRILELGGASMRVAQDIRRDQQPLVSLRLRLAVMNGHARPARIPEALRRALRAHQTVGAPDDPPPQS
ncbi:YbgC/FadM family acyl-CoA thioesterase [Roseospira goensis]|uniref:Acyl-CoA thioester hydrolase n=1 Tax=Roseospira goensis TaxID=391922 RepID=A0A7W6S1S9_9PROT|nr:acyl-CoA thioester hydrolase [Roseospira goensis]